MKIALVHEHLTQDGGAEKVLKALQDIFPQSPTFTLAHDRKKAAAHFNDQDIRTSFIQKLPWGAKKLEWFLVLMPAAAENYDLTEFDVVISSSSAFAKGIITKPDCLHLCYCHTPTRYLWTDSINYLKELQQGIIIKKTLPLVLTKLRMWDRLAAERVHTYIANSREVQKRIKKYYHRGSVVIYPPVEVAKFTPNAKPDNYFLTGGRLVPYKRFDLTVEAFNRTGFKLKIFGEGPLFKELRKNARPNIEFLARVDEADKIRLFENCLAFINPQLEDFGITAVEAMAAGRPVIAYQKGGALETVVPNKTGIFFQEQAWEDLADALIRFKPEQFNTQAIHAHAMQFDTSIFAAKIKNLVAQSWAEFNLEGSGNVKDEL